MFRQLVAACQHSSQWTHQCLPLAAAWGARACTAAGNSRSYHVAHLPSRGVISVKGQEAVQFMQVHDCDSQQRHSGCSGLQSAVANAHCNARCLPPNSTCTHTTPHILLPISSVVPAAHMLCVCTTTTTTTTTTTCCVCVCVQGMTTNDLRPLEQPGAGPVYTVLLTAKGKYLHDMFAYSIQGEQQHARLSLSS
jgi:hypothetical protein